MQIIRDGYAIRLQAQFADILQEVVDANEIDVAEGGICLKFRDPDYGPERGGFHPVEIAIGPDGAFLYINDFAYVGTGLFAELAKELDFDCLQGVFETMGRTFPLARGNELFQLWQSNFCDYYRSGVYVVETSRQ